MFVLYSSSLDRSQIYFIPLIKSIALISNHIAKQEVIGQVLNCVPIKFYYYFQLRSTVWREFNSLNIT